MWVLFRFEFGSIPVGSIPVCTYLHIILDTLLFLVRTEHLFICFRYIPDDIFSCFHATLANDRIICKIMTFVAYCNIFVFVVSELIWCA